MPTTMGKLLMVLAADAVFALCGYVMAFHSDRTRSPAAMYAFLGAWALSGLIGSVCLSRLLFDPIYDRLRARLARQTRQQ